MVRCTLFSCVLVQSRDPSYGLVVKSSSAQRCKCANLSVVGVRFEEVLVNGLATSGGPLILEACLFKQVAIKGNIGRMAFWGPNVSMPRQEAESLTHAALAYYEDVDWALDISEAKFESIELPWVPGSLVRYDPETQACVNRERARAVLDDSLPPDVRFPLEKVVESPFETVIIAAPKHGRYFKNVME